jgi:curli biogenesis system outer membrane secretion channel CsgG
MIQPRTAHLFLALLLAATASGVQAQQQEHKPIIGVTTFENPPNYANSTIGSGLTDLLTTELMKTGRYRLVERDVIDELIDEIDLGKSGYNEKGGSVPKGHFAGLEYLVIGKVTNFGERQKSVFLPIGVLGYRKDEAYVRIDFRIVDAVTREIIYSGYGEGLDKTSGVAVALAAGGVDVTSRSFPDSKIGRATVKAINDAVAKLDGVGLYNRVSGMTELINSRKEARLSAESAAAARPGKVLAAVSDDSIIVSLGSSEGLKIGDSLEAFCQIDIKDSAGTTVFIEERPVAILTITELQQDRSKATRVRGGAVEEGFIVRKQRR